MTLKIVVSFPWTFEQFPNAIIWNLLLQSDFPFLLALRWPLPQLHSVRDIQTFVFQLPPSTFHPFSLVTFRMRQNLTCLSQRVSLCTGTMDWILWLNFVYGSYFPLAEEPVALEKRHHVPDEVGKWENQLGPWAMVNDRWSWRIEWSLNGSPHRHPESEALNKNTILFTRQAPVIFIQRLLNLPFLPCEPLVCTSVSMHLTGISLRKPAGFCFNCCSSFLWFSEARIKLYIYDLALIYVHWAACTSRAKSNHVENHVNVPVSKACSPFSWKHHCGFVARVLLWCHTVNT